MTRCKQIAFLLALVACKGNSKSADRNLDRSENGRDQPMAATSPARPPTVIDLAKADESQPKKVTLEQEHAAAPATTANVAENWQQKNGDARKPEGVTRAWFPETFLFQPLVVTDDTGAATVPVRVPDRLTTWRVLALAHSRTGAQAGAVTSFLGTLPTYVDPVVPKYLVAGDEIRLPIQMINTTGSAVTSKLSIDVKNATIHTGASVQTIPAQGNVVEYATLHVPRAGVVELRAGLGDTDAVVRTIEIEPTGRPVSESRSGTLAAPRTMMIDGPVHSDPATDRVRLLAYPGALALLRSELGASTSREGVADDAYALLLAGKASELLASLGDKANPETLRELAIVTSQRALRDSRTLDVATASLLTEAALAHVQNPVLSRLGERAAAYLAQNQRPDGTFAGGTGWTLQRVLVATADATRAVASSHTTVAERQRAENVSTKAAGAFERNLDRIDGYTAAAVLASGAVAGATADKLRATVKAAIADARDGAKYLAVAEGVVRADGSVPSMIEATALAVLALRGDAKAPLADLGATLLGSYSPDRGWGDGRTNLVAMEAALELFKAPLPEHVTITLTMDGKQIAQGTLDRDKLREVLTLDAPAPGLSGSHEWKVTAEPAVPGLGYSLSLRAWVPWEKEAHDGVELALTATVQATIGKPTQIAVSAIAPSGVGLHIEQALPAGAQLDTPSLQALVDAGTLARFEASDGKVDLYANALEPGHMFAATYRVIPTLAGRLHTAASRIDAGTTTVHVPPTEWIIKP